MARPRVASKKSKSYSALGKIREIDLGHGNGREAGNGESGGETHGDGEGYLGR